MAKYDGLGRFLGARTAAQVAMTFDEIEQVVGAKLPASAHKLPEWWTNNPTGHVQARAWLAAGFEIAEVDRAGKHVVFKRIPDPRALHAGMSDPHREFKSNDAARLHGRHPMIGALKGLLTIEPGYDLTQ